MADYSWVIDGTLRSGSAREALLNGKSRLLVPKVACAMRKMTKTGLGVLSFKCYRDARDELGGIV